MTDDFRAVVRAALAAQGDAKRAAGQQAYMKSAMPFYGVPVPQVRSIVRGLAKGFDLNRIRACSLELWDGAARREERYAALALTGLKAAAGRLELVDLHEYQARTGAWWDFTDEIAHRIADLLDAHPAETAKVVRHWAVDESMWVRRLALLSQLQRHERTSTALLTELIDLNAGRPEFFIRKAIGWALRDYARTDPAWVRAFVDAHCLSPLSRREALKHL